MFNPYQSNIEELRKQRERLDNLINSYQQPPQQPINNIINTPQQQQNTAQNLIEWRILNENEEVDNLYVKNKTLFINDNLMVIKDVDGKLEKWEVKKVYPIDKKDQKISELEQQIRELKEMINNEHSKPNKPTGGKFKSVGNDDEYVKSESEINSK